MIYKSIDNINKKYSMYFYLLLNISYFYSCKIRQADEENVLIPMKILKYNTTISNYNNLIEKVHNNLKYNRKSFSILL